MTKWTDISRADPGSIRLAPCGCLFWTVTGSLGTTMVYCVCPRESACPYYRIARDRLATGAKRMIDIIEGPA
jgi:hypothetical protein